MAADDETYMGLALEEAGAALNDGEFPVGCVLVADGRVVARGRRENSRAATVNELDHAEIVALRRMATQGPKPAHDLAVYSTMEPCLMCYGALLLAGVRRIVYALEDVMGGAALSLDRSQLAPLYRDAQTEVIPGVRRREAWALFAAFFKNPDNIYWQNSLLSRSILSQAADCR